MLWDQVRKDKGRKQNGKRMWAAFCQQEAQPTLLRHSEDRLPFMTYLRGRGCWVLSPLGHSQGAGLPWVEVFHPHHSQQQVSSQSDLKEELGSTAELLQFDPQRKPHFSAI